MDIIEINRFTQEKKVLQSRNSLQYRSMNKEDALRLMIYATKRLYGTSNTAKILHAVGVKKIDLSI